MVYYPIPLNEQEAYSSIGVVRGGVLTNTKELCSSVLSLPMHTELDYDQQLYIAQEIKIFLNN
jgi:dTDP-4-amino-4,6-dideoxygalactose transaminase